MKTSQAGPCFLAIRPFGADSSIIGGMLATGDRGSDVGERLIGVRTDGIDRRKTNDDDQGKHHGIFNRRGAVLRDEKMTHSFGERFHSDVPSGSRNFGGVAGSGNPVALRPGLAAGLPFRLRDAM